MPGPAHYTSHSFHRDDIDLFLEEVPSGIRVQQAGSAYIARGWHLTADVKKIINTAMAAGLTSMIQRGSVAQSV